MKILSIFFWVLSSSNLYAVEFIYSKKPDMNLSDYGIVRSNFDKNHSHDGGKTVNAIITSKNLVGRVEMIRIYPGNIKLKARIDTGAETSSLHVTSTDLFSRNEEPWIHFTVTTVTGKTAHFRKKIQRIATIKRHHDQAQNRIVVLLGICLGNTYREVEVNLFDRKGLNYPILIGRNLLSGHYIVDSSQTFSLQPDCNKLPKK